MAGAAKGPGRVLQGAMGRIPGANRSVMGRLGNRMFGQAQAKKKPGAAVGGIGQKLGLGVGGTPPGMGLPAKLGMTVNAAPTGNVEPEGMIGREYQKASLQGRRILGNPLMQTMSRDQSRIPRMNPPAIVPPGRRRTLI